MTFEIQISIFSLEASNELFKTLKCIHIWYGGFVISLFERLIFTMKVGVKSKRVTTTKKGLMKLFAKWHLVLKREQFTIHSVKCKSNKSKPPFYLSIPQFNLFKIHLFLSSLASCIDIFFSALKYNTNQKIKTMTKLYWNFFPRVPK